MPKGVGMTSEQIKALKSLGFRPFGWGKDRWGYSSPDANEESGIVWVDRAKKVKYRIWDGNKKKTNGTAATVMAAGRKVKATVDREYKARHGRGDTGPRDRFGNRQKQETTQKRGTTARRAREAAKKQGQHKPKTRGRTTEADISTMARRAKDTVSELQGNADQAATWLAGVERDVRNLKKANGTPQQHQAAQSAVQAASKAVRTISQYEADLQALERELAGLTRRS